MSELHTQGLQYILEVALSKTQSVPSAFYLGWCTNTSLDENATLADVGELTGNGYARVAINSDGTDWTSAAVSTNAHKVTSKACTFTAAGGDWTKAESWFLATTADDTGKLIASGPLNTASGVTLTNGQNYDTAAVVTLTVTNGWMQEGLQYLLEVAFTETQSVPANFYLGLGTNTSLANNATLASITELTGNGYARDAFTAWETGGAGTGDFLAIGDEGTFTASGGNWSLAKIGFWATSIDGTGKLLAWWPVYGGSGYTVTDGASIDTEVQGLLTG